MQENEALILVNRLVATGEKHQDYQRTVDLAETYRIFITGENISKKLHQFVRREDLELFEQRVQLTKSITPAVSSSIRQPFNKVARNDRIKTAIKASNKNREVIITAMVSGFYGPRRKKNRGLNYWMKTRFTDLQFIDPNSWLVLEWDTPANLSVPIAPRPFEVTSDMAQHYYAVNDEVKWLFVKQAIKYGTVNGAATNSTGLPAGSTPGVIRPTIDAQTKGDGFRYTLYDEDVTVVYEQIDRDYLKQTGYVLAGSETLVEIKDVTYIVRVYTPKLGYAPVFRIGYKRDEVTNARTFVNPWHDALCFFDKSLKTVSELDLTMCLHTFPQKLQYVNKCEGESKTKKCMSGRTADGQICGACKGSGLKVHTTAQDILYVPMPDASPRNEDIIDLEKLIAYKSPPIELIKFQNEYTQQLERQAHQAVYNSQVFIKKAGSSEGGGQSMQTATEADFNMQSVYDALEPFTEKYSEIWVDLVTTFGVLAGETLEQLEIKNIFPADYKLKTGDILLGERKTAQESGAPTFLIDTIDDDLANIIYAGDAPGLLKYRTKRKFAPFTGSSEEQVADLLTSQFVPKEPKVLYSNFEQIFTELEYENKTFYFMAEPKQRELIDKKVLAYMARLSAQAPVLTIDTLRQGNPASAAPGDDEEGTEGSNPGSDAGENYPSEPNTDINAA